MITPGATHVLDVVRRPLCPHNNTPHDRDQIRKCLLHTQLTFSVSSYDGGLQTAGQYMLVATQLALTGSLVYITIINVVTTTIRLMKLAMHYTLHECMSLMTCGVIYADTVLINATISVWFAHLPCCC